MTWTLIWDMDMDVQYSMLYRQINRFDSRIFLTNSEFQNSALLQVIYGADAIISLKLIHLLLIAVIGFIEFKGWYPL